MLHNIVHNMKSMDLSFLPLTNVLNIKTMYFTQYSFPRQGWRGNICMKSPPINCTQRWLHLTLREPIRANPRHQARVCGRAQCGGGARRSAPEPEYRSELRERGTKLMERVRLAVLSRASSYNRLSHGWRRRFTYSLHYFL